MHISGMGTICCRGRGIARFEAALSEEWTAPERGAISGIPAYLVEKESLTDRALLKKMRRTDRFCKMAVLAACDAVRDAGIDSGSGAAREMGVILSTAFGPHPTTFRFIDDILDYGDTGVSPTVFSHSVHNAAVAYIASALDCRGPALTLTRFAFPFHQALLLARSWLAEGRCEHVLVGAVDECGPVMEYICGEKLRMAPDGKIRPFSFSSLPVAVPGEGAGFFLVSRDPSRNRYARISDISFQPPASGESGWDVLILEADGMTGDETPYIIDVSSDVWTAGYAPVFGSMLTGSVFSCAAGALMISRQMRYACPVRDNPHGIRVCRRTEPAAVRRVASHRIGCGSGHGVIMLEE